MQCGAAFADALDLHAKHSPVELQAAVDVGDGQIQMVDTLDLHGGPPCLSRSAACHDIMSWASRLNSITRDQRHRSAMKRRANLR
jgi:hypothetical protein